ncbi:MAG: sialate O-acetylesterase [Candidatus Omnitrophica bacterium]|nr:sialate O-acetylesterase [Candidatus Omnitrophota bacterium]
MHEAFAEIALPALFGDNMVFQSSKELRVWGWAEPDEEVTVSIAGETRRTRADDNRRWNVTLPPIPDRGPHELIVSGSDEVRFRNILIGEVWICAGQSNMEYPLREAVSASSEIPASDLPGLRLFTVGRRVADQPSEQLDGQWKVCSPESSADFSAIGYLFGKEIQRTQKVPVGLILTSWGGTPAEAWTPRETLQRIPTQLEAQENWTEVRQRRRFALNPFAIEPFPDNWKPASLFNGMVAPLIPFSIRGVIWYQGESNANRAFEYRDLFKAMIEGWREEWNSGNFPFLYVQLPSWGPTDDEPGESDWAELREAQAMAQTLPETAMAVTIDLGETDNVHPKDKREFAHRLALLARRKVYREEIAAYSPQFASMEIEGATVRITLKDAGSRLRTSNDGPVEGFAVAGENRVFYFADARIEGDEVLVHTNEVPNPAAVRYAWDHHPRCNLVGSSGLPVAPFRTDEWPGRTETRFGNLLRSLRSKVIRGLSN